MNVDLGKYYVRVVFADGSGFIMGWETGARYTNGRDDTHPLNASRIKPSWESEDDIAHSVEWMFTEGNYSCDCNKRLFLARAHQQDEPDELACGDSPELALASLTLIRPDGTERELATSL